MHEAGPDSLKSPTMQGLCRSHNSNAAIFKDGEILASVGEEPISRVKNHYGFLNSAINEYISFKQLFNSVSAELIMRYWLGRADYL